MKQTRLNIVTKTEKYPIIIGSNLTSSISKIFKLNLINFDKCLIVVDKNVPKKFISNIKKNLSKLPIIKSEIKEIKIHHETNKLLNYSIYLANENGDELVAEDYLLLALTSEKNNLYNIFKSQKINKEKRNKETLVKIIE